MKLFMYAIVKHPTKKQGEDGGVAELLVPLGVLLAKDESQAAVLAGRLIPTDHMKDINRIEVAVRTF